MSTKTTRTVVGVMAAALALTSLSIEPVRAASATPKAPVAAPAKADTTPTDISTRRRHYRGGGNPAAALAMFGVVAGSIAAISASRRHRHGYGVYYPYGGYGPGYGYYGPRPYYQPYGYGGYGYRPYW
jgi:hypothetical protein